MLNLLLAIIPNVVATIDPSLMLVTGDTYHACKFADERLFLQVASCRMASLS